MSKKTSEKLYEEYRQAKKREEAEKKSLYRDLWIGRKVLYEPDGKIYTVVDMYPCDITGILRINRPRENHDTTSCFYIPLLPLTAKDENGHIIPVVF